MALAHESTQLKSARRQRATIKGQLTRISSFLAENIDADDHKLQVRKDKLLEIGAAYQNIHNILISEDDSLEHDVEFENFEDQYLELLSTLNRRIEHIQRTNNPIASSRVVESPSTVMIRQANTLLPKIEIKPFDGNPIEWHSFHDTFRSLVHENAELPAVQKFHLLKNALRGEVSSIIAALNASEQNYYVAWDLLQKRCNRPRQIVQTHLKALLELPEITRDTPINLRSLAENAQLHVDALKALNEPTEHWNAILVYIISRKLDKNTRRAWERTLENDERPSFEQLLSFLNRQARGDEFEGEPFHSGRYPNHEQPRNKPFKRQQTFVATTRQPSCALCKKSHDISQCAQFLNLNPRERLDNVRKNRMCINCLRVNHTVSNCRSGGCRKCNLKHHTLLHFPIEPQNSLTTTTEAATSKASPADNKFNVLTATFDSEVLLGTATIRIVDRFDKEYLCRVLLDGGSQTHFMTAELADRLQLEKRDIDLAFAGLTGLSTRAKHLVKTTIKARNNPFSAEVTFIVLPAITGLLPTRPVDRARLELPPNIILADKEFHKPGKIDALIGNALFYSLLSTGQIKLRNESVILQKTRLGWIVTGETSLQVESGYAKSNRLCHTTTSLDQQVNKFWEIEEINIQKHLSVEERDCEEHFSQQVRRNTEGRYIVRLPFNAKKSLLGDSRGLAQKRFYSLERKLQANPKLFLEYKGFLDEYLASGHMTEVSQDATTEGFYLPHHAVIKESSATTKVRVVFDASAKSSTGVSLNDTLLVGATMQDTLFSVLVRFRTHVYVLTADIEKMFRQILVHSDDRSYQRILWRDSVDQPIRTYQLNTVTYGTASAPFLAVRCLYQLAEDEAQRFPLAAAVFKKDFYMDDLLTGATTREAAIKLRDELIELAKAGGFCLRQWVSNDSSLIDDLESRETHRSLCLDSSEIKKTLGVYWNPVTDHIFYTIKPLETHKRATKRNILSQIAQLFDPFGLLGPIIIKAKIIMQQLWKANLTWDESVPQHIQYNWSEFKHELPKVNNFSMPRKLLCDRAVSLQLHGFCDASESAYGACIYLRSTDKDRKHHISLLCAKSRVAPLKTQSLPRLELCAATLLTRLLKDIRKTLQNTILDKVCLWADSTIVLHWIKTSPHLLNTFVANRVSEIQTEADFDHWYHVATSDNPADFISRGQTPGVFLENRMWLKGPAWLSQDEGTWPTKRIPIIEIPEQRKLVSLVINKTTTNLWNRYSSISFLNRVVAYVLRFGYNARHKDKKSGPLSTQEIRDAHFTILKSVQAEAFASEIDNIRKGDSLRTGSRLLNLTPFLDEKGILRVGGRLKHAPISYSSRHPILLPRTHHVTELIIRHEHIRQWHAGVQATLYAVRHKYWPIDGKNTTRRILHRCIKCYKTNPKIPNYIMGNLPRNRITPSRPFQVVGIDYCGPFLIKEKKYRNRNKVKAYVAVFVCFVTKAVHLELVTDLTTESCLQAIKRLFARRGKAQRIYTDNATNFVGARNEILELQAFINSERYKSTIHSFLTMENIEWQFSPPRSPHFGGLWEAAVKSFKLHLRKTVGETLFTYEQLYTLIVEIEAILNSRPLIPLSSDPNDLIALTPGHLLIGDSLSNLPEHDFTETPVNRLSLWQHIQRVKQHFWNRWQKEYLQELHTRSKWHLGDPTRIKEGTLVLLGEDNLPPIHWKLGRITAVHPGADNIIRVVTVRTCQGTYKRSIKRVAPLPIETPCENN